MTAHIHHSLSYGKLLIKNQTTFRFCIYPTYHHTTVANKYTSWNLLSTLSVTRRDYLPGRLHLLGAGHWTIRPGELRAALLEMVDIFDQLGAGGLHDTGLVGRLDRYQGLDGRPK
jgi:hypothetical protein